MADAPPTKPKAAAAVPPKPVQIGGESFVDRILPHIKKIAWACVGVAIVVTVFFGYRAFKQRGERKSTAALADVIALAEQPLREPGTPADVKHPSFADAKERATAVLAAISKNDVKVTPQFNGAFLVDVGRFDDAIAGYRTCDAPAIEGLDGVLCREGLGLALEAKAAANPDTTVRQKGYEEALAAFKVMQPDEAGPRAAYAKYHEGRMLELLNKRDDAKTAFEKAKDLGKDANDLTDLIEARLATLGA